MIMMTTERGIDKDEEEQEEEEEEEKSCLLACLPPVCAAWTSTY
jgi:hypothetical protein